MTDRLTQLQDALDDLATQFYASIRFISTHSTPPLTDNNIGGTTTTTNGQDTALSNNNASPGATAATTAQQQQQQQHPPTEAQFLRDQRELAQDLILKERQIEYLVTQLPGIGTSEREQAERLRLLEAELRRAEEERARAVAERERVLGRLERVLMRVRRV